MDCHCASTMITKQRKHTVAVSNMPHTENWKGAVIQKMSEETDDDRNPTGMASANRVPCVFQRPRCVSSEQQLI